VAGIIDLLPLFLGGDRCLGSLVLLEGDLLIDGVDINRRWTVDRNFVIFFDDGDVRVLVPVFTLAFDGAIGNDNEDPEHPEENADAAAKYKCYGSTFPATQMHQRVVEAGSERTVATTEAMVMKAVVAVVRV